MLSTFNGKNNGGWVSRTSRSTDRLFCLYKKEGRTGGKKNEGRKETKKNWERERNKGSQSIEPNSPGMNSPLETKSHPSGQGNPTLMESELLLPCSPEPFTLPYTEPVQLNPHPYTYLPKINFNIILISLSGSLKRLPRFR
jgi:hypothetical protein